MSDPVLAKLFRDIGWAEAVIPATELQQGQANKRVIDQTGAMIADAIAPYLRGERFDWGPGDTKRQPTEKAGSLFLIRAYAGTAPSTGDATITVTMVTESGSETIATVRIPDGQQFSDPDTAEGLPYAVPAAAWLGATVTTANGASGVNIAAFVK